MILVQSRVYNNNELLELHKIAAENDIDLYGECRWSNHISFCLSGNSKGVRIVAAAAREYNKVHERRIKETETKKEIVAFSLVFVLLASIIGWAALPSKLSTSNRTQITSQTHILIK